MSFRSNYALNKLLDKLPAPGPEWKRYKKTITGDLRGPDGEFLTEDVEMWYRDIIALVREIIGNSTYGSHLVFAPKIEYVDDAQTERKYDEMWMADWWLAVQVSDACLLTQRYALTSSSNPFPTMRLPSHSSYRPMRLTLRISLAEKSLGLSMSRWGTYQNRYAPR